MKDNRGFEKALRRKKGEEDINVRRAALKIKIIIRKLIDDTKPNQKGINKLEESTEKLNQNLQEDTKRFLIWKEFKNLGGLVYAPT